RSWRAEPGPIRRFPCWGVLPRLWAFRWPSFCKLRERGGKSHEEPRTRSGVSTEVHGQDLRRASCQLGLVDSLPLSRSEVPRIVRLLKSERRSAPAKEASGRGGPWTPYWPAGRKDNVRGSRVDSARRLSRQRATEHQPHRGRTESSAQL